MKKTKNQDHEPAFEEGSGNAFADLELSDADERFTRSKLGFHVYQLLTGRKLKQREIAELLRITQPEVSHLLNGHFNRFTTDKLLEFLRRLDRKVTIQISASGAREGTMRVFREGRRIVPALVLLGVMLAAAGFPASGDESQPPPNFLDEAKANFKDWDLNGDGTLSFQETTRLVPRASFQDTRAAALASVHLVQRRPSWYKAAFSRNVLFAATPGESDPRPPFEFYYRTGLAHIRATERTLFAGVDPNLRTIRQGPLGDCYFLATLGRWSIATRRTSAGSSGARPTARFTSNSRTGSRSASPSSPTPRSLWRRSPADRASG